MRTLINAGELVKVRFGVYATRKAVEWADGDDRREHALQVLAAIAVTSWKAAASHDSAAFLHGIDMLNRGRPQRVTLTMSPDRRRNKPQASDIHFHAAALPPGQVTQLYGAMTVTSVARTVVDLARTLPFMDAVAAADSALRSGEVAKPALRRVIRECGRWPGIEQAERAVEFADPRAESVFESCARVVFARAGLEAPVLQHAIVAEGRVYRVDFYYPRHRTVLEADGLLKYETKSDLRKQFERDRHLRAAGYKVVHFTWRELFDTPEVVIDRIRTAFTAPSAY